MNSIHKHSLFLEHLKATKQWGIFVSFTQVSRLEINEDHVTEMQKSASFLTLPTAFTALQEREGFFTFESKEKMQEAFETCQSRANFKENNGNTRYVCYAEIFGPLENDEEIYSSLGNNYKR